jgi:hypothetical protein
VVEKVVEKVVYVERPVEQVSRGGALACFARSPVSSESFSVSDRARLSKLGPSVAPKIYHTLYYNITR